MSKYPREQIRIAVLNLLRDICFIAPDLIVLENKLEFIANLDKRYISDLDLYVPFPYKGEITKYLKGNDWLIDINYRFGKQRSFFVKNIEAYKLKLDITFTLSLYSGEVSYGLISDEKIYEQHEGINFLNAKFAQIFIKKKASHNKKISDFKITILKELGCSESINVVDNKPHFSNVDEYFSKAFPHKLNIINRCKQYLKNSTSKNELSVCFVGLDGAGKGTYIELLEKHLKTLNLSSKTIYLGHSNYKLGVLSKMKAVTKPSKFNKLLYLILFPIELLLRKKMIKGDVVIYDRHPIFEEMIPRKSALSSYNKLISFIAPKPSLFVYLNGDTQTLWLRKKEMSISDYEVKHKNLEQYYDENKKKFTIIKIDTVDNVEAVYDSIWSKAKGIFRDFRYHKQ